MRRAGLFVTAFVVWLVLATPYNAARLDAGLRSAWDLQSLLLGLAAALLVALVVPGFMAWEPSRLFNPVRWFWGLVYLPVLLLQVVRANLQVAYMVLHPSLPIRPGTVKVKTRLRTESGRAALANSITLTPGTLTVDIDDEEGILYVHWLSVESDDIEGATRAIAARFEPLLMRIFE